MLPTIITNIDARTLEETTEVASPAFPYRADIADMGQCVGHSFPWHWHTEVEVFYALQGDITYYVPSGSHVFHEGDAGFINSGILHMTRIDGSLPSLQQEHIFSPRLIGGDYGSLMETRYVHPLTANHSAELLCFPAGTPENARLFALMKESAELYESRPMGFELRIRALMSELWLEILTHAPSSIQQWSTTDDQRIKQMMQHIAEHYAERLTLRDIASSAHIGTRECCRCFQRQLSTTPFAYLIEFRIGKACELLRTTTDSIAAISEACGFSSASYFGKLFREKTSLTPRDYRTTSARALDLIPANLG